MLYKVENCRIINVKNNLLCGKMIQLGVKKEDWGH